MGVKVGYIDGAAHNNIETLVDVIKPDVLDDPSINVIDNPYGGTYISRKKNKAIITLELDYFSQINLGNLRKVLNNSSYHHKVYVHHPAHANQQINYAGISNPSASHIALDAISDNPALGYGSGVELSTVNYNKIDDIDGNKYEKNSQTGLIIRDYVYVFFRFKLTGLATPYGANWKKYLERITFFVHNLWATRGSDAEGLRILVYNETAGAWQTIARENYTISEADLTADSLITQQYYGLGPMEGFTNFEDYIDGSDYISFAISNINAASDNLITLGFNYVELLVNGYGVAPVNADNFGWHEAYTGNGYVGTLQFKEI